jgi:transposase
MCTYGEIKRFVIRCENYHYEAGKSYFEIGRNLQLNRATVYAVVKRYRERGDIENRPRSGRKKKLDDRDTRKLLRLVKNNRSLPLQDITRMLMKIGKYLAILKFPKTIF